MADDRGVALLMTLLVLIIVTTLVAGMTFSGRTEMLVSRNYETAAVAMGAAEGGLNHAVEVTIANLQQWQANGFATPNLAINRLLRGPDDTAGTADDGCLADLGIPCPPAQTPLGTAFGASYEARVYDEDDPARGVTLSQADLDRIGEPNGDPITDENTVIVVQAIGYGPDNASVMLESTVSGNLTNLPAIVTNGNLDISNNSKVLGTEGSVHANGTTSPSNLRLTNNTEIEQDATTTGTYSQSDGVKVGGISGGGHTEIPIFEIQASNYRNSADYVLTAAGQVTDAAGNPVCSASPLPLCILNGWTYNSTTGWASTDTLTNSPGTYYVEANPSYVGAAVTLSGNLGTLLDPASVSVIAEGSIKVEGNTTLSADTPGLLFVTDGDLYLGGNFVGTGGCDTCAGSALVREQFRMENNTKLTGNVVVEDAATVSSVVTQSRMQNNAIITYNGGGAGGTFTTFTLSAWREVR